MDPIGAISLVILLLILAMCAGLLVRRFVYGKEPAELKKNAEQKKQQSVPAETILSDVQEAANQYIGYPPEVDEGVCTSMRREAYAAGMLAERERLMKEAIDAKICIPIPSTAYIKERNIQELRKYIVDNFKDGERVKVIIIKEEDEK